MNLPFAITTQAEGSWLKVIQEHQQRTIVTQFKCPEFFTMRKFSLTGFSLPSAEAGLANAAGSVYQPEQCHSWRRREEAAGQNRAG